MTEDSESSRGMETESKGSLPNSADWVASQFHPSGNFDKRPDPVNEQAGRQGGVRGTGPMSYSRVRRASMVDLSTAGAEFWKKPRFEAISLLRDEHLVNQLWNISTALHSTSQPVHKISLHNRISSPSEPPTLDDNMDDSRRQSGLNSPSSFRLPSFSSISSNVSPSGNTQQGRRDSIHENQVDAGMLRQQLIARDHTIANLRREQEQLQASILRTQSRYEALETKSQVTDHEMVAVSEEKNRLKQEVATLATQVEQLTHEREELQNQARADGAQWRQIMSMSSKLQMQNVEESRRFTADREQWIKDREKLEQRINELEEGSTGRQDSPIALEMSQDLGRSLTLSSMSEEQLRQEISGLRQRCQELEEYFKAVMKESASIERTGTLLKEVRKRLSAGTNTSSSHRGSDLSI